ncbi:MAG: restriction endonuclease subunit S [Thiobacillus sp.]|nr:restriction endonuclease subunit S [Thiobacillus sp.]
MSFPRYPNYKDSGVEWLGAVPGHWDLKRIGYYFSERREKASDKDFPALSVTKYGIVPQLDTAAKSDDSDNRKKVLKGDFVINSRSDRKGSAGASELDGSVSLICTVLKPQEQVHTPFVHHLLRCQPFQEEFYRNGKGIVADLWSTNYAEMRNILLGMPPLAEQTQIAAFLDRETAKIDELVAEQRRLMELLKEKRQAVISHAVTQGLNPDAPMKPSGIEWLGDDVPEHWEVGPLKRYWSVTDCKHVTAEFVDDGIPLASIREVQSRWVALENAKCTTEYFYASLIEGGRCPLLGDLIFSRNATVGEVAQVNADHPRFAMGQDVVLLRKLSPKYSSDYLQHVIRSPIIILQLANMMIGSTFKRINVEEIRSFVIPSPPQTEQAEIAAFLESEVERFDALTAEAQRAIDLLQERRTALISAAVTGQIDVRGLNASAEALPEVTCV